MAQRAELGLVGRREELRLLVGALEDASSGRWRLVVVEGEAGIGKTSLVQHFLATRQEGVGLVAVTRSDETEMSLNYGVLGGLARSLGEQAPWGSAPDFDIASPADSFRFGGQLLDALAVLQKRGTLVVVLDDFHWVDLASAQVLLFALRRLEADQVLVVLTHRPGTLSRLGESWTRLIDQADNVVRIRLGGLDVNEVARLAASLGFGSLSPADVERLRAHTDGHPLYIRALLEELPADALDGHSPLPAPHSFAATVLTRLSVLSPAGQDLVAAVAAGGRPCPLTLAAKMAGLDGTAGRGENGSDPAVALEEAVSAGLLVSTRRSTTDEIDFSHPLIGTAVYEDLSPKRRRDLHLAAAAATTGASALAHRVAGSQGPDPELGADLIAAAQEEAGRGALAAAAEHLLWAAELVEDRTVRDAAVLSGVEATFMIGDRAGAENHRGAVETCAEGPWRSLILGLLDTTSGRFAQAESELRSVIRTISPSGDAVLLSKAAAGLAMLSLGQGRPEEAIAWGRRALESGSQVPMTRSATICLALGLAQTGRREEAFELLTAGPARGEAPPLSEGDLLVTRAQLKLWGCDYQGAVEDVTAALSWSRGGGPMYRLPIAYAVLSEAEFRVGAWDAAIEHGDMAVSLAGDVSAVLESTQVHAPASYPRAARGEWADAQRHVDAAASWARDYPLPVLVTYAALAAGMLARAREDWPGLLAVVEPLLAESRQREFESLRAVPLRSLQTEALIRAGRLEEAEPILRALEPLAAAGPGLPRLEYCRLSGLLEIARDHVEEGLAKFGEGVATGGEVSPLSRSVLELEYGRALRAAGQRRLAIAQLTRARERLESLGAAPFRAMVEAELTLCGVHPAEVVPHNPYGLTSREQVIAGMVSSGMTNREVAAELYVSPKTVEYHLGNVFAKVGVNTRQRLSRRLAGASVA